MPRFLFARVREFKMTSASGGAVGAATMLPDLVIRADHPQNCDLLLVHLGNTRLRGTIVPGRGGPLDGPRQGVPGPDQSKALAGMPTVPGQELTINFRESTVTITDPLATQSDLLTQVNRYFATRGMATVAPCKTSVAKLDKHQIKTLARECLTLLQDKHAVAISPARLLPEDIDKLPGDYLATNGMSTTMPRFEKDMPKYLERLNKHDG